MVRVFKKISKQDSFGYLLLYTSIQVKAVKE